MGESSSSSQHQQHQPQQQQQRQRVGGAVGEVVEVQGGHIVRATGRKDRHSKVCTAKGPRDRRVRLAAHTAIQFYDVQDRLGYDRPSKAVDWLIKKAKSSIDELAHLPAWHPTATTPSIPTSSEQKPNDLLLSGPSTKRPATTIALEEECHHRNRNIPHNPNQISSFLPPSMDSDVIADTIKSFFPVGASAEATSSALHFSDLMSRSGTHTQDLRLSLHSLQDSILHSQPPPRILSGTPLGFDGGWTDNHHHQHQHQHQHQQQQQQQQAAELSRLQRYADVTPAGYFFNPQQPPPPPLLQQLLGHNNQFVSQRGPLQSSNTPSVRAWIDPSSAVVDQQPPFYPPSVSGIGFASGYGGFPGFHVPARIQGDEEDHDGYSDKPSSASSDSRH